jgi:hypothetical protein
MYGQGCASCWLDSRDKCRTCEVAVGLGAVGVPDTPIQKYLWSHSPSQVGSTERLHFEKSFVAASGRAKD